MPHGVPRVLINGRLCCSQCKSLKELTEFSLDRGTGRPKSACKSCQCLKVKQYKQRLLEQGRCGRGCGNEAVLGHPVCATCRVKYNKYNVHYKNERTNAGIYSRCGGRRDRDGWLCLDCKSKYNHEAQERRKKLVLSGQCRYGCGPASTISRTLCASCVQRRKAARIWKYGISPDDYLAMWHQQGGKCAVCREPEVSKRKGAVLNLAVDHCHKTGRVRGLLCSSCNGGMGLFKDSPERLMAAIRYLQQEARGVLIGSNDRSELQASRKAAGVSRQQG